MPIILLLKAEIFSSYKFCLYFYVQEDRDLKKTGAEGVHCKLIISVISNSEVCTRCVPYRTIPIQLGGCSISRVCGLHLKVLVRILYVNWSSATRVVIVVLDKISEPRNATVMSLSELRYNAIMLLISCKIFF